MSVWGKVKGSVSSLVDMVMPPLPEEETTLEEMEEGQTAQTKAQDVPQASRDEVRRVVNGGTASAYGFAGTQETESGYGFGRKYSERKTPERPVLTVHTTKSSKLKVNIYAPTNFDQVTAIADDIKDGKAAVVNYERVDGAEQRRICDFVNGTCYVMDGCARRVTGQIVLYVPTGVDVAEAMCAALG